MDAYSLPSPLLLRERPLVTKEQTTLGGTALGGTARGIWPRGWGGGKGLGDDASFRKFKNKSVHLSLGSLTAIQGKIKISSSPVGGPGAERRDRSRQRVEAADLKIWRWDSGPLPCAHGRRVLPSTLAVRNCASLR